MIKFSPEKNSMKKFLSNPKLHQIKKEYNLKN